MKNINTGVEILAATIILTGVFLLIIQLGSWIFIK